MLFNSIPFLLFLPLVFAAYWATPGRRAQNALLVAASYVFYGWWDWRFLSLIVFSTAVDYAVGRRVAAAEGRRRRAWLALSLGANLGLLGVCKYFDFFARSAAAALSAVGFQADLPTLGLVLPVGISFYTFQTLSYTLDVYRGQLEPTDDPVAFAAFVAFFPQLVAGPIERASHLLGQFAAPRRFDPALARDGARQALYGLVLKVLVADNLAASVDPAYAAVGAADPWDLLWATFFFALQIYGDFAGYSHMAIGIARGFGFDLRQNFATPYFAESPGEFWRRWHISLSTWFRDYVYVPLGGGRVGEARRRLNVLLTFVLSGLWHGASWTFVVWGALHGALVAALPRRAPDAPPRAPAWRVLGALLTFAAVCLAWVFFRARSLGDALTVLGALARLPATAPRAPALFPLCLALGLLLHEWTQRARPHGLDLAGRPLLVRWGCYVGLGVVLLAFGREDTVPFIYFQF
ncbi:MAG: MBOAT family protein [Planctomycetota bacterium]